MIFLNVCAFSLIYLIVFAIIYYNFFQVCLCILNKFRFKSLPQKISMWWFKKGSHISKTIKTSLNNILIWLVSNRFWTQSKQQTEYIYIFTIKHTDYKTSSMIPLLFLSQRPHYSPFPIQITYYGAIQIHFWLPSIMGKKHSSVEDASGLPAEFTGQWAHPSFLSIWHWQNSIRSLAKHVQ